MKWFLMTLLISLVCAGCLTAADIAKQNANAEKLIEAEKNLTKVKKMYAELREDFLSGKLDIDTFTKKSLVLKDDISDLAGAVSSVKDDIMKQSEGGNALWITLLSLGVNVLARGLPSKGPLGAVFNKLTPWRKDDR